MDSLLPHNWVPPDTEEVEEYACLLALLDEDDIKTMTHEDMVINQAKLATFAKLPGGCWNRTVRNTQDIRNAPAVYQQLVVNRTRGAKWLVQIEKALARAGTLTAETTWTQMNQATGVHNAKILTPTFKKQLHAETKPVAFAHLLRNFMMLITAQMRGSRLGMHSASVPQPNQHDGVFT